MKNSLPQPDAPLPKGLLQHLPNGSAQSSGEVAAVAETIKKRIVTAWRGLRQGTKRLLAQLGPVTCANSAVSLIFCARDCGGRAEHASSIHGRMRFDSVRMCFVTAGCVRCSTSGMTAPSRLWYSRESRTCVSHRKERNVKGKINCEARSKAGRHSQATEKSAPPKPCPTNRQTQTDTQTNVCIFETVLRVKQAGKLRCPSAPCLCKEWANLSRSSITWRERERERERGRERESVCVCVCG